MYLYVVCVYTITAHHRIYHKYFYTAVNEHIFKSFFLSCFQLFITQFIAAAEQNITKFHAISHSGEEPHFCLWQETQRIVCEEYKDVLHSVSVKTLSSDKLSSTQSKTRIYLSPWL